MKAVGIILAGGKSERLGELTALRAASALPIGSSYRLIDFSLSNMTNSGVNKVAVITQFNSRSLNDHLSSAKWWDLGRKQGGLFVFTPFLSQDNSYWFRGTADSIYQNISYLKRSNEPYVLITSGDGVYKMDYSKLLDYHIKKDADITIACKDMGGADVRNFGVLKLDGDSRITALEEKPLEPDSSIISLGIYVISRTLLIKLLETVITEARYDFVRDVLMRYHKRLNLFGCLFDGYWASAKDIKTYYDINMDFLRKDVRDTFIASEPYIETKPKDEPPAKYNFGADVHNCLVGSGSILNGTVNKSVLFRKVYTGENSVIKDSVVMEGCYIGNNCLVENCVLDKEVILSDGKQLRGTGDTPMVVRKGTVI